MSYTASLNEIAYSILNTVRPKVNNSEVISIELIKFHIKNVRAQLIKQDANKGYSVDSEIIQSIDCIELERGKTETCCDIEVITGCNVLKTKQKIPGFIELRNKQLITRIGPVDKFKRPFDIIPYERVPFELEGANKFTKQLIKAFTINDDGYVYLLIHPDNLSGKVIKYINIQGVFEDPEKLSEITNCEDAPCYNYTENYPVKSWMIPVIQEIIIKKFLTLQAQAPIDPTSDGKHNVAGQNQQ